MALLAVASVSAPAAAASFDCAKASTVDEKAVCADPQLSELDSLMGQAFLKAKSLASESSDRADVLAIARQFMKNRGACGLNNQCILVRYAEAIEHYQQDGADVELPSWLTAPKLAAGAPAESAALPTGVGQCSRTEIASITPRLETDVPPTDSTYFDSGTAVNFANGGHQVSYEREAALVSSRPGDAVVMCLTALPRNCPKDDDRGKIYTATNLRANATWTLPDSQHSCGGA
jgi:uncharacterized protein